MAQANDIVAVRVEVGKLDYVEQLTDVLSDLECAYNALYYFFDLSRDLEDIWRWWRKYWPEWPPFPSFPHFPRVSRSRRVRWKATTVGIAEIEDFSLFVLPDDRLALRACRIGSPGWMDVIGTLNPLEVLRQWAHDRHERRKDQEYRQQAEKEKLGLENELLKNKIIRERIDLLKELGVPRSSIKEIVNGLLVVPMKGLEKQVNHGNIRSIESAPPHNEEGRLNE